ncbi:MAG TPA: hypothetical protein VEZ89_15295 [Rubrivivax sp.]|nr:hypothetical protein [Rubrivivax sp.]
MLNRLFLPIAALLIAGFIAYMGWILFASAGLAIGVLVSSPIIAFAVASPLRDLVGGTVASIRAVAYRDLEGRHFEYKGRSIDVREDLTGARWVKLDDVRKVIAHLPNVRTLMKLLPDDVGYLESPRVVRVSAKGLDRYLSRNEAQAAIRFRVWLQREVVFPADPARRQPLQASSCRPPS